MVVPVVVTGGVVGPVVEQTSPVIAVCVAMLELVKVLETTAKVLVDPSGGAVWANPGADMASSATRASSLRYAILLMRTSVTAVSWRRKELARLASGFIFFLGCGDAKQFNAGSLTEKRARLQSLLAPSHTPSVLLASSFALCGNTHRTSQIRISSAICYEALFIARTLKSKRIGNLKKAPYFDLLFSGEEIVRGKDEEAKP